MSGRVHFAKYISDTLLYVVGSKGLSLVILFSVQEKCNNKVRDIEDIIKEDILLFFIVSNNSYKMLSSSINVIFLIVTFETKFSNTVGISPILLIIKGRANP
ncbi:hypothetical protein LY90DRAFT_509189 [Neocallimastix californiae]|uniref:Uncharacterized protein n=1 Tax=Neocallimastix californiae TaxID=1754190 RepID=A0A1Y2CI06_9FUNG|nr:hypothetical protein LY90DRAFT_509189 [Neocallimastix californiae]|eukprot:ORY46642.1 hypothetical protein LY90DRAFT_509189 [Neocallimastix californiae]